MAHRSAFLGLGRPPKSWIRARNSRPFISPPLEFYEPCGRRLTARVPELQPQKR